MEEKSYLKYQKIFSPKALLSKLKLNVLAVGEELIIKALELYYATYNPLMPLAVKLKVYGALGYFILPLDLIPDFIPVGGYSDDLAAILYTIALIEPYIDEQVRQKARQVFSQLIRTKNL